MTRDPTNTTHVLPDGHGNLIEISATGMQRLAQQHRNTAAYVCRCVNEALGAGTVVSAVEDPSADHDAEAAAAAASAERKDAYDRFDRLCSGGHTRQVRDALERVEADVTPPEDPSGLGRAMGRF